MISLFDNFPPISGTYSGLSVSCNSPEIRKKLELRIDLDGTRPLNVISGDFFQHSVFSTQENPTISEQYLESFICNNPIVIKENEKIIINGVLKFYYNEHPLTQIQIEIQRPSQNLQVQYITVKISFLNSAESFNCQKISNHFRIVNLEIENVKDTQIFDSYELHSVQSRPLNLPNRKLTLEEVFGDAGVELNVDQKHTRTIDPRAAGIDRTWTKGELYVAMQNHFKDFKWQNEPQWKLYLLIATNFELPGTFGTMFDDSDVNQRQGAAIFYNEIYSAPADKFEQKRDYLFTCIHELGHAFNLEHSFKKSRPDSLSFMNYSKHYPSGSPSTDGSLFWSKFEFKFDDLELLHIRHHDRSEVIMGGERFTSQGEPLDSHYLSSIRYDSSLSLEIRSKPLYTIINPEIRIELKFKNLSPYPIMFPNNGLNLESGLLEIYIYTPTGKLLRYNPLVKNLINIHVGSLEPNGKWFGSFNISYGRDGFYFRNPGLYRIRCLFHGAGYKIISNIQRIYIRDTKTSEEEDISMKIFNANIGKATYFETIEIGEDSKNIMEDIIRRYEDTSTAASFSYILGMALSKNFKFIKGDHVKMKKSNLKKSEYYLKKSLHGKEYLNNQTVLDNLCYNTASTTLSEIFLKQEDYKSAISILDDTIKHFKELGITKKAIHKIKNRKAYIMKKKR